MFGRIYSDLIADNMNEVAIKDFASDLKGIGTIGLRSCAAILIVSRDAAILAHVSTLGHEPVMDQLETLYLSHRQRYFHDHENVWTVTGIVLDDEQYQAAMESFRATIEARLARIPDLPRPQNARYSFHVLPGYESPEFRDKGTVAVDARSGIVEVWVEDRLLYRIA